MTPKEAPIRERPTLATIAAALGVSRATVSNAYNRPDQLSPALRERILATAASLGYAGPDPAARSLRQRRVGAVGVMMSDRLSYAFSDPAAVLLLDGLAEVLEPEGAGLLILPGVAGGGPAPEMVRNAVVDGLVSYCLSDDDPALAAARARRVPLVLVDDVPEPTDAGEASAPGQPGEPGEPGGTANTSEPGAPGRPSEPGRPGGTANTSEPGTPGRTSQPGGSGGPGGTADTSEPGASGRSSRPGEPDERGGTADTSEPRESGRTGQPGTPGRTSQLDEPGEPRSPGEPGGTGESGALRRVGPLGDPGEAREVAIRVDDPGGAAAAARHLVELGHRRIVVVTYELARDRRFGPADGERQAAITFSEARERLGGYRTALVEAGFDWADITIWECTHNSRQIGREAATALLERRPRPTAILAMSDEMAMGILEAARDAGIDVPGELSVVGFDDVPAARHATPPLTTVRQPLRRKGELAGLRLLDLRAGRVVHTPRLPTELVVRATTAPPPPGSAP